AQPAPAKLHGDRPGRRVANRVAVGEAEGPPAGAAQILRPRATHTRWPDTSRDRIGKIEDLEVQEVHGGGGDAAGDPPTLEGRGVGLGKRHPDVAILPHELDDVGAGKDPVLVDDKPRATGEKSALEAWMAATQESLRGGSPGTMGWHLA